MKRKLTRYNVYFKKYLEKNIATETFILKCFMILNANNLELSITETMRYMEINKKVKLKRKTFPESLHIVRPYCHSGENLTTVVNDFDDKGVQLLGLFSE